MRPLVLNQRLWFVLVSLFCSLFSLQAESTERQIYTERNTHFEIIGEDRRSVLFVRDLSEQVARSAMRMLSERDTAYPSRILITLEEKPADGGPLVRLSVEGRGAVRADFRWSGAVSLQLTTQALAHAYLLRYAYYAGGPDRASQLPEWTISAVSLQSYLSLRPAVLVGLMEQVLPTDTQPLDIMLSAKMANAYSQTVGHGGYWLWTLMKGVSGNQLPSKYLQAGILSGVNPQSLKQVYQSNGPEAENVEPDEWWLSGIDQIRSSDLNRYETLETSHAWIELLSEFEGLTLQNGAEFKNLKDLWVNRREADLRSALEARRELLVLRLDRVNPAYYNAARSLGALYETVLESDQMGDFIAALAGFLSEFEDTKRLEKQVQVELSTSQS